MVDFTSFIEANQNAAIACNSTGEIARMNKPAEALLECRAEEVIGKHITELLPALKSFFVQEEWSALLEKEGYLVGNRVTRSGKTIHISILPNELKLEDQTSWWFILKKITSFIVILFMA
ncbi:MAG: PAS domain S-box protein, partial [Anaerolineales bacterium]